MKEAVNQEIVLYSGNASHPPVTPDTVLVHVRAIRLNPARTLQFLSLATNLTLACRYYSLAPYLLPADA